MMKMGLFHKDSKERVYRRYFTQASSGVNTALIFFPTLKKYLSTRRNFSLYCDQELPKRIHCVGRVNRFLKMILSSLPALLG